LREERGGVSPKAQRPSCGKMIDTIPILVVRYSADRQPATSSTPPGSNIRVFSDEGCAWARIGPSWRIPTISRPVRKCGVTPLAKGEPVHTEVRLRRATDSYRWFAVDRVGLARRERQGDQVVRRPPAISRSASAPRKHCGRAKRNSATTLRTASDWLWRNRPGLQIHDAERECLWFRRGDRIGAACWDHALDLETEPEKMAAAPGKTIDSRKPFRDFVYRRDQQRRPSDPREGERQANGLTPNGEFRGYRGVCTDVDGNYARAQEALA